MIKSLITFLAFFISLSSQASLANVATILKGFEFTWQRDVYGFAIPHRLSFLSSKLGRINYDKDSQTVEVESLFGANTGVDGNYMYPMRRTQIIQHPKINVQKQSVKIQFVSSTKNYQAHNKIIKKLIFNNIDLSKGKVFVPTLDGFEIRTKCLKKFSGRQFKCNSDGVWPNFLNIETHSCKVSGYKQVTCMSEFELGRAWTKNRGGIAVIHEKPINIHVRVDAQIQVQLIQSQKKVMSFNRGHSRSESSLRFREFYNKKKVQLNLSDNYQEELSALAVQGIGFEFAPSDDGEKKYNGRFIGGLSYKLNENNTAISSVWLPVTVVYKKTISKLKFVELNFKDNELKKSETLDTKGKICIPSKDEAPWFSKWNDCSELEIGEQEFDSKSELFGL